MLNRKELLNLILVVLLLIGIPFAVFLIRQQQILRSRASVVPIVFTGPNVKTVTDSAGTQKLIATDKNVQLQLTSTLDQLLASSSPTSSSTSNPTTAPTAAPQQINHYIMQALIYKDGHYEERKCPLNPNAGFGIDLPEAGGMCTLVRSIPGVGNTVADTSMFVGTYQGNPYMFLGLLYKDGHYEERRCPLNPNAKWGIDLPEAGGMCTLVRSIPGVADSVASMSMFTADSQGISYAMQALLFKDGHYEERKCPLNPNAKYGIDTPDNGNCISVRNIAGVANVVADQGAFTAEYNGQKYMMQSLLYKDGHYEERRCPLNPNAKWGIDLPEAGGMCTLVRSIPGVANSVSSVEYFEADAVNN